MTILLMIIRNSIVYGALAALIILGSQLLKSAEASEIKRPRLVVTVVIDQFRGDYINRFYSDFKKDGFRRLIENGVYYPQAEFNLLQCMTGPGHSVVSSGSYPHATGLVLNYWLDRKTGKNQYCVKDLNGQFTLNTFTGTTIGDEFKNSGYASKVVSIALKDRAALLMGGHRSDLTLWWGKNKKSWEAYREKSPEWLSAFNQKISANSEELATAKGYKLTNTLVQQVIQHEQLGQDSNRTDFLWVSYSSFDYAGHAHGANSEEMKQMTLSMDQSIADLISIVSKETVGGLNSVLIALTGDHGVGPAPSYLKDTAIPAGKIDMTAELVSLEGLVLKKFGKPKSGKWILGQSEMNLYLNPNSADEKRLENVAQFLKSEIEKKTWVQGVLTLQEFRDGKIPTSFPKEKALKTIYPTRSGDVIILPKPFFIEYDARDTAAHFTPYPYDCQVPLIMMGPGLKRGKKIPIKADVADWAVTLSYLLGTQPPALSSGRILNEAIQD